MKRKIISIFATALACLSFAACSSEELIAKEMTALPHFNGVTEDGSYDSTYFYRNDLKLFGGDVDVEWVPEDRVGGGYFYMYSSGNDGVGLQFEPDESKSVVSILRSKDLNDWELCGNISNGFGVTIAASEWIINQIWAPEVIYNPSDETYYLYVTGQSPSYQDKDGYRHFPKDTVSQYDCFRGAIFMSKNPSGPFELATSARYYGDPEEPNLNGKIITGMTPHIDPKNDIPGLIEDDDAREEGDGKNRLWGLIDFTPLFDDNGDLYLYFNRHMTPGSGWDGQETWGVKMKDMITPDWSTFRLLLHPSCTKVTYKGDSDPNGDYPVYKYSSYTYGGYTQSDPDDSAYILEDGLRFKRGGEGSFALKHEDRYYLATTPGGFGARDYVSRQCISDSPLGPFERIPMGPGEVLGVNETNDFLTGIGHAAYVEKDGELFSITFAHADPLDGNSAAEDGRIYCFDRVTFIENETYGMLMYGNGPTQSLQPKIISECNNGMKNIAVDAKITATNAKEDTIKYLNDGKFVALDYYKELEFESKGKTTITLEFDTPREIGAIMIYNSYQYDYAFSSIDNVQFLLAETPSWYTKGNIGGVYIKDLPFNNDYVNLTDKFMRAGGSALASFEPIKVNKISITVSKKFSNAEEAIKISDIVVLGK